MKADYSYPSKVNLSSSYICSVHFELLSKSDKPYSLKKCVCCECFGKKSSKTAAYRNINPTQALVLHEKFGINNSYEELICTSCRVNNLPGYVDLTHEEEHGKAFEWLNCLNSANLYYESESDDEEEFQSSHQGFFEDDEEKKLICKKRKKLLNQLLSECGSNKKAWVTFSYKSMREHVKTNFLSCVRSILKTITTVLAPDEFEEVFQDAVDTSRRREKFVVDGNFFKVMTGIKEAYENPEDSITRKEILSIVAPKITFKMIQDFIRGLTPYRFTEARFYAADTGVGVIGDPPSQISQRFSIEQLEHFIDFIVSPHICTDIPFGENCLKLSDGTILFVPNTIRNMAPSRIINQYTAFCEENVPGFSPLQSRSVFKILEICKASCRRSLQGLNYFAVDGGEAFDSLSKIVQDLNLSSALTKRLCDNLKRGRQYLKSDFKAHISKSSHVADHCATYALSDIKNSNCRELCDHLHDAYCIDCEMLSNN